MRAPTRSIHVRKAISVFIGAIASVFLFNTGPLEAKTVRFAYVEWSEAIASSHMVQAVLHEKMGIDCQVIPMTADKMWLAVADGEVDAMVAAWLPSTLATITKRSKTV